MSSLVHCLAQIFHRRKYHRRSQPGTPRRRSVTSAVQQTNESERDLVPETTQVETQESIVRRSEERPVFAPHISEEPTPHSNLRESLDENNPLNTNENDDEALTLAVERMKDHSSAESATENRNSQDLEASIKHFRPKSHLPKFSYEVRQPTLTDFSIITTHTAAEDDSHLPPNLPSPLRENAGVSGYSSDASSNRSRSASQASSTKGHWLKEKLENARIECPGVGHSFLIPRSKQEELITVPNVTKDILARDPDIGEIAAAKYANDTCRYAQRLYATLAYVKKGAEICQLLAEGVTDEDLPLVRTPNDRSRFALVRQNGKPIATIETWADRSLEKFDRVQWWMNAPIFVPGERHIFEPNTILPFIPFEKDDETQEKRQGAYSKVYPVMIHHAHHEFYPERDEESKLPLFAVKELFSSERSEFVKEATILEALGPRNHPHLIKLLATYEKNDIYHLVFPYANANLRKYWDDHATPEFDRETVLWVLKQMTGIASGIMLIHEFRLTKPLLVSGANKSNFRNPDKVQLSVKGEEKWYGRHGDIKPENILWFSQTPKCTSLMGVLQIADFGLGRFHGRDSRSGVSKNVVSSPTYEPPECKLSQPVSRKYDIWSLGCLYLEFITWLLKGNSEIDGFSNARGRVPTGGFINDDNFYTITTSNSGTKDAEVRAGVRRWVEDLHAHPKCSPLIHDLLDLIMVELLVVDPEARSKAAWLHSQLKIYLHRAERDDEYLLKPSPILIRDPEDDTNMTLDIPRGRPKRNSVTFTSPPKPIRPIITSPTNSQPDFDRLSRMDLVGRARGTPAANGRIEHPKTWPDR